MKVTLILMLVWLVPGYLKAQSGDKYFINGQDLKATGQSEEHLVLKLPDGFKLKVGDILYGVPVHICPTVALYERAFVIEDHHAATTWKVVGRDRSMGI